MKFKSIFKAKLAVTALASGMALSSLAHADIRVLPMASLSAMNLTRTLLLQAAIGHVPLSPAQQQQLVEFSMYVDIRELVKYEPSGNLVLAAILAKMNSNPDAFVSGGEVDSDGNPIEKINVISPTGNQRDHGIVPLQLFGVERVLPRTQDPATGEFTEYLRAFYQNSAGDWLFRVIEAHVEKDPENSGKFRVSKFVRMPGHDPIPADQTHFHILVGAEDRTLVLEDESFGIRKIYPVGVGNKHGDIRAESESMKQLSGTINYVGVSHDDYWMPTDYEWHAMALRIEMHGDSPYISEHKLLHGPVNPTLKRGWVSAACLRMQVKDVNEIYFAVRESNHRAQVIVQEHLEGINAKYGHPYPLSNATTWDVPAGYHADN